MTLLSNTEVTRALADLEGWSREGEQIVRDFQFPDFVAALGFIVQVGALAERADHHPDLHNVYDRVRVALSTHDAGGITQRDVSLAAEINRRSD